MSMDEIGPGQAGAPARTPSHRIGCVAAMKTDNWGVRISFSPGDHGWKRPCSNGRAPSRDHRPRPRLTCGGRPPLYLRPKISICAAAMLGLVCRRCTRSNLCRASGACLAAPVLLGHGPDRGTNKGPPRDNERTTTRKRDMIFFIHLPVVLW
jgi:hypothetical protein